MTKDLIHFKVFYPGNMFYFDTYAINERELRENLRNERGIKRLPNGIFIEKYNHKVMEEIQKNNRAMVKDTQLCTTDLY